jgi:hypothetical protein
MKFEDMVYMKIPFTPAMHPFSAPDTTDASYDYSRSFLSQVHERNADASRGGVFASAMVSFQVT